MDRFRFYCLEIPWFNGTFPTNIDKHGTRSVNCFRRSHSWNGNSENRIWLKKWVSGISLQNLKAKFNFISFIHFTSLIQEPMLWNENVMIWVPNFILLITMFGWSMSVYIYLDHQSSFGQISYLHFYLVELYESEYLYKKHLLSSSSIDSPMFKCIMMIIWKF